jgi:hypothetical protein
MYFEDFLDAARIANEMKTNQRKKMKAVISLLFCISIQNAFSQGKSLSEYVINYLDYVAYLETDDTLLRAIIVSDDLKRIYNLNDTTISREFLNSDTGFKSTKYFRYVFFSNKTEICDLIKAKKKDRRKQVMVAFIHGWGVSENHIILKFNHSLNNVEDICNKKKALMFSFPSYLLYMLGDIVEKTEAARK